MKKELSQLDRASRFAIGIRGCDDTDVVVLKGNDLIDAKALGVEFISLLERWTKKAEQAREAGKLGGRPKKLKKAKKKSIKKAR